MQLNITLNVLDHTFVLTFGAGAEKDQAPQTQPIEVTELTHQGERATVGFRPNDED